MPNECITSFNAGELSPLMEARASLDKYRSGCRTLENFLITPYGPVNRRPGTQYLGAAKNANTRCRLIGLNLSDSNRYVMEIGVGYIRFWANGALLTSGGSPVEATGVDYLGNATGTTPHPYQEADLRGISYISVNNVVYLAHASYPPMRLSHYSDTNWTIGEVPWKWAPMTTQNITTTTITPSATTGTGITLTSSVGLFQSGHVGSYWQLSYANPAGALNQSITGNTTTSSISVTGNWTLQTWGTWSCNIAIQQSTDGGTNWTTIRNYFAVNDANYTSSGTTAASSVLFRLVISGYVTASSARVLLTPIDPTVHGYVKVTAVSGSPTVTNGVSYYPTATADVVTTLPATTATATWREGAFSAVQGYPNDVSLHESRVIYGGTNLLPTSVWGSYVNDFQNFKQGALDSDSFLFNLASTTGGRIQWMVSKQSLLIGTAQDEWVLASSSAGTPLTPSNVQASKQSHYGSAGLPALIVNDTILYVQRMARKIREFIYTWQSQTWVSSDLTALAEQSTRNNIVELAYARVPDAVYWFVRGDGQLVSMTYEREQQVTGFARHKTNGTFESVCTINGNASEDEVWVAVNRTINGATVRYIERIATGQRTALDTADKTSWWYVDAGLKQTLGAPSKTITGLSHLNGMTVSVWADSAVGNVALNPATGTAYTVSGGSITLQSAATVVLVGLPFTSTLIPQRIAVDLQDGSSQGRRQTINKSNVKVYQSLAGEISADGVTWSPLLTRRTTDHMDSSPPAYNGWQRAYVISSYDDTADIYIRQTLPVPLSICAVALDWEMTEQD